MKCRLLCFAVLLFLIGVPAYADTGLNAESDRDAYTELYFAENQTLAEPLEVPLPPEIFPSNTVSEGAKGAAPPELILQMDVQNPSCGWTLPGTHPVFITDGTVRIFPVFSNSGRISSSETLPLHFLLPESSSVRDDSWKLVIPGGIYSWETPVGEFSVRIYTGERLLVSVQTDTGNRMFRAEAAAVPNTEYYVWRLPSGECIKTSEPKLKGRFPILAPGENSFSLNVSAVKSTGKTLQTTVTVPENPPLTLPVPSGKMLAGCCFYPSIPDAAPDLPAIREVRKILTSWNAPKLTESRYSFEYVNEFLKEPFGNLAVFWSYAPGPAPGKGKEAGNTVSAEEMEELYVKKLAGAGIYSMTIYQHAPPTRAQRLARAGDGRFLNNNLGEYASYMYQGPEAARACGIPEMDDVLRCRDFFVETYIRRGVSSYKRSYPFLFSTSGSTLANDEMEGGVDFLCSELFAVGAQNLAYASAEMRGAARKWGPAPEGCWGGWLAHEWQTCDIPYDSPVKFRLLEAALSQQFLLGSSFVVLESGSQTTQAGFYTRNSGKKNFSYDDFPPSEYRRTMKRFYDFTRSEEGNRCGMPQTRIALAHGNGDSYVGMFLSSAPVWGQHETAEKDPRWRYGTPEKTDEVLQKLLFPCDSAALSPYENRFLAGNPFGCADVTGIDENTRPEDLARYSLILYGGWNTMTPRIAEILNQYVENGGTVFLSLPHFSTRTDRESQNYGVSDLLNGGNLAPLFHVRITGRKNVSGNVTGNAAGNVSPETSELFSTSGFAEGSLLNESAAEIQWEGETPEILARVGETPVLVREKRGKGAVYLLLAWEYPGKPGLEPLYSRIVTELARRFPLDAVVEAEPEALALLSWSVFEDKIYVLNLDCSQTVFCRVRDGKHEVQTLELSPCEMRILPRQ